METYNKEDIGNILVNIVDLYKVCLMNKDTWNNDKEKMMDLMEQRNALFFNKYYRICKTLVEYEDITPLITMLKNFYKVQTNKTKFKDANDEFNSSVNAKYVEPILQSEKLVNERNSKINNE